LEPDVKAADAVRELAEADPADLESTLGAALAAVVAIGREHDIDAESALASWTRRYKDRFRAMEQLAVESGVDLVQAPADQVRDLWERAGATA
jgi:tetrapyrrole methylase family protein/MazG family protein